MFPTTEMNNILRQGGLKTTLKAVLALKVINFQKTWKYFLKWINPSNLEFHSYVEEGGSSIILYPHPVRMFFIKLINI